MIPALFWPVFVPPPPLYRDARFGDVNVAATTSSAGGAVLVWLDGGGALALPGPEDGVTVVRVSAARYVAKAAPHGARCFYPASDLEELAQDVEKRIGRASYVHPVVGGDGAGATLALQALESAPEGTFAGAVSFDFSTKISVPSNFCAGDGPRASFDAQRGLATIAVPKELAAPWRVVQKKGAPAFPLPDLRRFAGEASNAAVLEAEGDPLPALRTALAQIQDANREPEPPSPSPSPTPSSTPTPTEEASATPVVTPTPLPEMRDLRLHDIPPDARAPADDRVLVLLTGDGGWAGIDRGIAAGFAAEGMRTLGWDSLAFFWKKKSPDEVALGLEKILRDLPPTARVIASGFSFGADTIPFAVNRLPPEEKKRIAAVVLIAPSKEASFEIHPLDWIVDTKHGSDKPTAPELTALTMPVICLVPSDDKHSPCAAIPSFTIVKGKAGHHLGGDYHKVARSILDALDQAVPPR